MELSKTMLESIKQRIDTIIQDQLNLPYDSDLIKPNARFVEDLGCDSLDSVCIIMNIESEFRIDITDEDLTKIKTVQECYDYIANKIDNKQNKGE